MKYAIFVFAFFYSIIVSAYQYGPYTAIPVKVIDGDTIKLDTHIWPGLTQRINLRLNGIDTPELRSKDPCEKDKAIKARSFTQATLKAGNRITITNIRHGKYAGRIVGDLIIDGQSLSNLLLNNGYARKYSGRKKQAWCKTEAS